MSAPVSKIRLRGGFDLPIPGAPVQRIEAARAPGQVALLGDDFPKLRLALKVEPGERVRSGQALLVDRRNPEIRLPSPASGRVAAAHRGSSRQLVSVAIEVAGRDCIEFPRVSPDDLRAWSRERVAQRLLESGDWIALRARPYGTIARPGFAPAAIFVRAMDSNPLAADAAVAICERLDDLAAGLIALSRLTDGPLFLCSRPGAIAALPEIERLERVEIRGAHPAGLVGTHVHRLLPVSAQRRVWYVGYQDVAAIGQLLREGRPDPSRVISLAGPAIRAPRLLRTVIGASTEELIADELSIEQCRIVSGSLLSGRVATGAGAFLGRYDEQLCALPERAPKTRSAWWIPGWRGLRRVPRWRAATAWTNEAHGEPGAFFPLELFDRALPLRLPIAPLLRALAAGDVRTAAQLGALELEEEDLALCSWLCPAKLEYGPLLRKALDELAESLL